MTTNRVSLSLMLAITCLIVVCVSSVVMGQGGTGRETTAPPPPKRIATKKTTPTSRTSTNASKSADSESAQELEFWSSIKDSTDPEDFKAYLDQYPTGNFVALAKNRLKNLEAKAMPSATPAASPAMVQPGAPGEPTRTLSTPINSSSSPLPRTRTNQTGIEFVLIPPGSFMMGSDNGSADEKPVHQVTINYSFYMGKYEVTQAQWRSVMGNNPSYFKDCGNCPVEQVSWNDAQEFIRKLNAMNDGYIYRLPTEAEWEYACRAGTTTAFSFGDSLDYDQANFKIGNRQKTTPVGSLRPNDWGLYDMHGNVWEWCEDWYHETYYGAPADGSAWLSGGEQKYRVVRGGSWELNATFARSAHRNGVTIPGWRYFSLGLRVVAIARTQ